MKQSVDLYPLHTETIRDFMKFLETGYDDPTDIYNRVYNMLGELLRIWSTNNKMQLWKDVKVMNLVNYIFLTGFDEASGVMINVGIYAGGIYFKTNMAHQENLFKMKDDFWLAWLELTKFGDFVLEETEAFPDDQISKYPKVFRNKKSSLIQLMRGMLVFPMLNAGFDMDQGFLSITWPPSKYSFNEVVTLGSEAFGRTWKLNQRLAKHR